MSRVPYDEYYKKKDYFGNPYPGLKDFFCCYPKKEHVLDLGCGQGRDTLFIAKQGLKVTAVDISQVGLEQLKIKAESANLDVTVIKDNIYTFPITKEYDIVLLDSILHFYKKDILSETELVKSIALNLKKGGLFVNFMIAGSKREHYLKTILNEYGNWSVLFDDYTEYPEFDAKYHRYILKASI